MDRLLHLHRTAEGAVSKLLAAHGLPKHLTQGVLPKIFEAVKELVAVQAQGDRYYIKVWRPLQGASKKTKQDETHLLIRFFEPGGQSELDALLEAKAVLVQHPGSVWAVSSRCSGACAGLPVVFDGGE